MKKAPWLVLTAAILALLAGTVGVSLAEDSAEQRLDGEYIWNWGSEGPLEAVFVATGEGTWDVDFHFTFDSKNHVYRGTAKGSLAEGSLSGKVKNENKRRTFTFRGTFEDGVFRGTHAETTDGQPRKTGTLTLGR